MIDTDDIDGQTPLDWAMDAYEDDSEDEPYEAIVQLLLERGARLDTVDGGTHLHRAAAHGWETMVRLFIQAMAERPELYLDYPNDEGFTPFQLAVRGRHIEAMELLGQAGLGLEVPGGLLESVACCETVLTLERLQVQYKDQAVHGVDNLGFARLHRAVAAGDRSKIEWLIQQGAAVNVQDSDGFTPLHIAARNGREDLAELLVQAGALLGAVNYEGDDPRALAERYGHDRVVALLDEAMGEHVLNGVLGLNVRQDAYHPLIPAPNPNRGTRIFYYSSF